MDNLPKGIHDRGDKYDYIRIYALKDMDLRIMGFAGIEPLIKHQQIRDFTRIFTWMCWDLMTQNKDTMGLARRVMNRITWDWTNHWLTMIGPH